MDDRVRLVYAGARRRRGKLVYVYADVDDPKSVGYAQTFAEPLSEHPPGSICSYIVDGGHVVPDDVLYEGIWSDERVVAEWTALHDAVVAAEAAWEAEDVPGAFEYLEPVRAAYQALRGSDRDQLLALVVRFITEDSA